MSPNLVTTSLPEICKLVTDGTHSSPKLQSAGIPFIKGKHISSGKINFLNCDYISNEDHLKCIKRVKPCLNDVLFANIGSVGDVARVKNNIDFSIKNLALFRPDPQKVDPIFFYYLVSSSNFKNQFLNIRSGSAQPFISLENFRNLKFKYIKDLTIQKKIADILSAYDELIENNTKRIQLLEKSAHLLYKEWFINLRFPGHEHVNIIDGVPEGWERRKLGDIIQLNYGKALKKDNRIPGDFPVYGSSGIVGSHIKPLISGPNIILGRKGNVGSVFWSSKPSHPIDTVYYISPDQSSLFLYYALKNTSFISTDVAVPGLNRDLAYSRFILKPENKIQRLFENIVNSFHKQIDTLNNNIIKLQKARDLLLPRLMNGEIKI